MQDYWNDPPECPEVPECCDQEMTVSENGDCLCETCGQIIERESDIEPMPDNEEPIDFKETETDECPHGKKWGECDACDHASDIAFDAARERRFFSA